VAPGGDINGKTAHTIHNGEEALMHPEEVGRPITVADVLVKNWPWIALRGLAALAFGLLTMFQPGIALSALILLFGALALVDGVFTIVWAVSNRRGEPHWGMLLVGGLLGVGLGVLAFVMPGVTAVALLYLIAAWAIIVGATEIAAAVLLRKVISGEWLLALAGVLSILFGLLVAAFPQAGALAIVLWIGAYATVVGVLLLVLAFKLRSWGRRHHAVGAPRTA